VLLLTQSLSQDRQFGPARIHLIIAAIADTHVEVRAAMGAIPLTRSPAQGVQRQLECKSIPQHRLEIDIGSIHEVSVVFHGAIVSRSDVELAQLDRKIGIETLETARTFEHHGGLRSPGHQDPFNHTLETELGMYRFLIEVGQRRSHAVYRGVEYEVPVFAGPSEYLGYGDR
jgi:hypothetical protein